MKQYRVGRRQGRNIYMHDGGEGTHVGVAFTEADGRLFVEALNFYHSAMEKDNVTFSIVAAGTIEQAREQVAAARCYGSDEQFDTVKAFILTQLTEFSSTESHDDAYTPGVVIEASGHDGYHSACSVNLSIRPIYLPAPAKAEVAE